MKRVSRTAYLLLAIALLWSIGSLQIAAAQEPVRSVFISSSFTNIQANKGEEIRLPLTIANKGTQAEDVTLEIVSGPTDWDATFRDRGYTIRGVFIPAGGSRDVDFAAKSPAEAKGGDYTFVFKASTKDKKTDSSFSLTVGLAEKTAASQVVSLTARYPVLQGASGTSFIFSVDLKNESDKDRSFDLSAKVPQGWNIGFRPAFESDKQITTLRVEAETTRSLDIQVTSPNDAAPDEYPISLKATSANAEATIDLKAVVTGKYSLFLTSPTGRLNTETTVGKDSIFSIEVSNTGSGELKNISFSSLKPDGWIITFEPNQLPFLQPGDTREVTVKIRAADDAIAGDYMVTLTALGDRASAQNDFRVMVKTPTIWGVVGIGIVVLVIAGLAAIFWRTGRR